MNKKRISVKAARLGGILSGIAWIVFCVYGFVYDYFDTVVFLTFGLGMTCSFIYAYSEKKAAELFNLLAAVSVSFGLGLFFLNSHPVWADRLNHITLYGSRGTLLPVVIIMILCFAAVVTDIVSCFSGKEEK